MGHSDPGISCFREGVMRQDNDFVDVVCEDGQMVDAHMVILASSSPILMDILSKSKQPKTLINMRGTKWKDLVAVLDFIYIAQCVHWAVYLPRNRTN